MSQMRMRIRLRQQLLQKKRGDWHYVAVRWIPAHEEICLLVFRAGINANAPQTCRTVATLATTPDIQNQRIRRRLSKALSFILMTEVILRMK